MGQLVYSVAKSDLTTGSNTIDISTKELSAGMYTLFIKSGNQEPSIQKIKYK